MMKFMMISLLVSIICMFCLVNEVKCSNLHVAKLQSCLIDHNVHNVSLFPTSANDPSPYFKFLNFSIQNLRFLGPAVPKPVAVVIPDTKDQLISTVLCCRNSGPWEIRIRCGGHSYEGSSYVADGGLPFVLIDMMNLDRVSVDLGSEVAWAEGGATLGQIYYEISRSSPVHGFSAGSCPTVGSGGHIGGGGFGLLSRKYGLAADNVVDALLIDASGRVLDRRAMGEEVFWAIRGGGGGVWGVVYAWKVRLVWVPPTVTSFIVSREGSKGSDVLELVDKWQRVAPTLVDDFYLSVFVGSGLPEAEGVSISATFKGFYLGNKSEALSVLGGVFPELRVVEKDCKEMSWIESIVYFSGMSKRSVPGLTDRFLHEKNYFKAKSDYVRHPIPRSGLGKAIKILEKEPKGYVVLDPYGGAMHQISSQSIAFPHRKGNLFTIQYLVEWREGDNDRSKDYIEWIRGFYDAMMPYVSSSPRAAYVNYVDFDLGVMAYVKSINGGGGDDVERARVWGEKYFLKNYDRLVRAKTLIDPLNVFRNQQGIPPLVNASGKGQT